MESVLPVQETKDRLRSRYKEVNEMRKRSSKEKLTHESIANECGVSLNAVNAWFSPKRKKSLPGLESWIRLSEILDCDLDYLIGLQDMPRKEYAHASEVTGLSYQACEILSSIASGSPDMLGGMGGADENGKSFMEMLSKLIEAIDNDCDAEKGRPGYHFWIDLWCLIHPDYLPGGYETGEEYEHMYGCAERNFFKYITLRREEMGLVTNFDD